MYLFIAILYGAGPLAAGPVDRVNAANTKKVAQRKVVDFVYPEIN